MAMRGPKAADTLLAPLVGEAREHRLPTEAAVHCYNYSRKVHITPACCLCFAQAGQAGC